MPRKKKTQEPVAEVSPVKEANEAVRSIMEAATVASKPALPTISVTEPDLTGKSALGERTAEQENQADFIPGTKHIDLPYIPEFVYDELLVRKRRLLIPSEYHYVWVQFELITRQKAYQYQFCKYDGGAGSGLGEGGFKNTGLFERTIDGRVMLGDTYLMFVPMRRYEAILEQQRQRQDALETPGGALHAAGNQAGVRTFVEGPDGQLIYN